ncbi:flagellar type III secretion system pore protein FliP [Clostridium niameyense]|uniref:Flagellar biosynthetic protein FliP n=2 Tax=Clostridium niameyense TaxID=1622073 RepID=A0A6M0R6N2_9CLOT|nr:flagellar type III secretion system pore protein FliP [Clostridium niameyense]NEZ45902.1 flagellar type III secretion system pore protein FliP [Clostridium niameyense]
MKKKNKKWIIMATVFLAAICFFSVKAYAAPDNTMPIPKINISVDNANSPKEYVDNIKLLILLTVLTLLPSFIVMMTSFVRIIVVFGFLKNAMGTQQSPPNQVLIGLALFLTLFIMQPVYSKVNTKAIQPYVQNKITQQQAIEEGAKPLREFMLKQTRQKDLKLFVDMAKPKFKVTKDNVPLYIVVPSYIISELKTAFQIGFLLFIPFLIIDLVVASVLMSMGMFMLPPVMVSLPFKLLLFVMVDGWHLLVKSLVMSFS